MHKVTVGFENFQFGIVIFIGSRLKKNRLYGWYIFFWQKTTVLNNNVNSHWPSLLRRINFGAMDCRIFLHFRKILFPMNIVQKMIITSFHPYICRPWWHFGWLKEGRAPFLKPFGFWGSMHFCLDSLGFKLTGFCRFLISEFPSVYHTTEVFVLGFFSFFWSPKSLKQTSTLLVKLRPIKQTVCLYLVFLKTLHFWHVKTKSETHLVQKNYRGRGFLTSVKGKLGATLCLPHVWLQPNINLPFALSDTLCPSPYTASSRRFHSNAVSAIVPSWTWGKHGKGRQRWANICIGPSWTNNAITLWALYRDPP